MPNQDDLQEIPLEELVDETDPLDTLEFILEGVQQILGFIIKILC